MGNLSSSTPSGLYKEHIRYLKAMWKTKLLHPSEFDTLCRLDSVNPQRFINISYVFQVALLHNDYDYIQLLINLPSFNKLLSTYVRIEKGYLMLGKRAMIAFCFAPIWSFMIFTGGLENQSMLSISERPRSITLIVTCSPSLILSTTLVSTIFGTL
jgi:hypothetical protein